MLLLNNRLVGYTLLRKRNACENNKIFSYYYFDAFVIHKEFRNKGLGKQLILFNNKILNKLKTHSFLICPKNTIPFYLKYNWKILPKNKFKVMDHKPAWLREMANTNGMTYNLDRKVKKEIFYYFFDNNKMIDSLLCFARKGCSYSKRLKIFLKSRTKKLYYIEIDRGDRKISLKKYLKRNYSYIICFRSHYILKRNLINKAKIAAINYHPGTPNYRGIGCVNYALYNNAKYYGSTCHLINEKIDNGKILNIQKFKLKKDDSVDSTLEKTYGMMLLQAKFTLNYLFKDHHNLEKLMKENKNIKWSNKLNKLIHLNKFYEINKNIKKNDFLNKIRASNTDKFKPYINLHGKKFILE